MRALLSAVLAATVAVLPVAAAQATPDVMVVVTEHDFQPSTPIAAGPLLWHFRNDGDEVHQARLVRLPDGVNEAEELAWLKDGAEGPEPGSTIRAFDTLAHGEETSFQTDLTAGRYVLVCAMPEGLGRHFELGMIYRFSIE